MYHDRSIIRQLGALRAAERVRRIVEKKEAEAARQRELQRAASQAYERGAAGRREMERLMAHPIAQQLLASMGAALGRAVAEKAEEEGTPGIIALKCAHEVWSYVQKTGAPLEDTIKAVVEYHIDKMQTAIRVSVPEMSFEHRVDATEMRVWK